MNNIILYLFILSNFILLSIGYLIGKSSYSSSIDGLDASFSVFDRQQKKKKEQNKVIEKIQAVSIDESTFVVHESTDGMEKKFEKLGEDKSVNESIESSVNKLSQLIKG